MLLPFLSKRGEKKPIIKNGMGIPFVQILLLVSFLTVAKPAHSFIFDDNITQAQALAHYIMGQVYDLYGYTQNAVMEYEKSAQFDESAYPVYLRLGLNYAKLNMLDEAKAKLKFVHKLNPDDMQSHYMLALIYSAERDYDLAALEYEYILQKFTKNEPQNAAVYGYLAQLYYSQKKYNQAIDQYKKVLEFDKKNVDVMYLLGSLYFETNQADKSIEVLQQSIAIDPKHDGSLNTLGYIYVEQNEKLDEAVKLIQRAIDIDPENGAYLDSLGWAYFKLGEFQKAYDVLIKADAYIQDAMILDHLGDVCIKLNRKDDAIKYWESALELQPNKEEIKKKINELKNSQAASR